MTILESRTTRVAFYGRFADEPTRRDVAVRAFRVELDGPRRQPIYKLDGAFAFVDIEPSAAPRLMSVQAQPYRERTLSALLPTLDPVELSLPGEDEEYFVAETVVAAENRVTFRQRSFLPSIAVGSILLSSGGLATTLAEVAEGEDVDFLILDSVAGLAAGELLRAVRSNRLLLRPGPYYRFTAESGAPTVLLLRVVDATATETTLSDVALEIDQVNAQPLASTPVSGLALSHVQLAAETFVLGPADAIATTTNARGEALLTLPAEIPATQVRLQASRPGYAPLVAVVAAPAGEITRTTLQLTPA